MFNEIPPILIQFFITLAFSFTIGLEQRKHFPSSHEKLTFGTDRTFVFIGLIGFVLLVITPGNYLFYSGGAIVLSALLSVFYFQKINIQQTFGMTTVLLAMLTYLIPIVILTQPKWFSILYFVILLILSESKKTFSGFSEKIDSTEFITLAKFLIIAGVILPVLPNEPISDFFNFSPYKIWLAIVVISGISYLSYLLRKFVFPSAGVLVTGILGGLYSSTATTIILARKSKEEPAKPREYAAAIIMATAMMFLRIYLLMVIFSPKAGLQMAPEFVSLFVISILIALYTYNGFKKIQKVEDVQVVKIEDNNPLEFKVAIIFAFFYVFFSLITQFTLTKFGANGLNLLSYIVGFTDIDPFLLNLFQGKFEIKTIMIGVATLQAILSNNMLKLSYSKVLGSREMFKMVLKGFGLILISNILIVIVLHFYL
jgi:uncharacterized membrane protein (DUF4010 family)